MSKKQKIDLKSSMLLRVLHQEQGLSCPELVKRYGNRFAERSIYRHAKKSMVDDTIDKRKFNKGRPRKITPRMERIILRTVKRLRMVQREFSSWKIQGMAGFGNQITNRDIRRCLQKIWVQILPIEKEGVVVSKRQS